MSLSEFFLGLVGFITLIIVVITLMGIIAFEKSQSFLKNKQKQLAKSFHKAKEKEE